jgi:phosphatidylglycerophosphate synthase
MLRKLCGSFGYANLVTAGRCALVLGVASLALGPVTRTAAWTAVVVGTVAALLDIVDGQIARRTRTSTPFGARFDMEVDAALIMTLAVLAWRWEKAGTWVLLSGALRYAFVAAGWALPWLNAPLPPSLRRKTICVVQIVSLLVVLGPVIVRPLSTLIAGAGLCTLVYSFLVDTMWLRRRAATPTTTRGRAFPSWS